MDKKILEGARYCINTFENCFPCLLDCGETSCVQVFAKTIIDHHEKYCWHDLRKNPDDLPVEDGWFECVLRNHEDDEQGYPYFEYNEEYGFGESRAIFDRFSLGFVDSEFHTMEEIGYEPVVAWREKEPFESEACDE